MKKNFLVLITLLCCSIAAVAVPAKPGWQVIHQSDGTTLKVQVVGNSFSSAILTSDGLAVERGQDGDFYYTSSLTGLTAVRAHELGKRSASENAFINIQRGNLEPVFHNYKHIPRQSGRLGISGSNADASVPAMGQRHVPIILVQFKDVKFNTTRQDIIDKMLTGNASVNQYFRDQSNGLYDPQFDVYGIYTVSQNRAYYGAHSGSNNDKALGALVTEACQKAAADGVSFKPYDTNSDNYCDVVIVIFAGVGEAQARTTIPDAIWPCNWDLNSAKYYNMGGNGAFKPSYGDPYVNTFAVFNELHGDDESSTTVDGIGTFCHEFGHCLGLPDFYDTGERDRHIGLGDWDIMCRGSYNNDTYTPAGYSAYEKAFMGWIDYITPQPGTYYTLPIWNLKNAATDKAVCMVSPLNANEYFIIENRKKQGWDEYLPGEGIMITHVTYNADRWWSDSPNNEDIQLMTLMSADNSWTYEDQSTDLWPLGSNNAFTDTSSPAARLNMTANGSITGNAGYLGTPVTDMVINPDGTASFWYVKSAAPEPTITVSSSAINFGGVVMNTGATKTITVGGEALTGDVTLTLNDANGVFSINPTVISANAVASGANVTLTFNPTAIQDYAATLTLTSDGAQDVVVNLSGRGLVEGYTPVMSAANSSYITSTSFRADWTHQTSSANVASYTLQVNGQGGSTPVVTPTLLSTINGSSYTGNYRSITLQSPWGGSSVMGGNNAVYVNRGGKITFTIPSGYSNATFSVLVTSVTGSYGTGNITVQSTRTSAVGHTFARGETYTWIVTGSSGDVITLTTTDSNYSPDLSQIRVYAGNTKLNAAETGNATNRTITGITDKYYTVEGLTAKATYTYKVKAIYTDGSESDWSNEQTVTLKEEEPVATPTLTVTPASLSMTANMGETKTATFKVTGADLTGNVTLTMSGASVFSITPSTITAADAASGVNVTVTYKPTAYGTQTATVTVASPGAASKTVALTGNATIVKENPVMNDATGISSTGFTANWTHNVNAASVSSYSLHGTLTAQPVNDEPEIALLGTLDGSQYSGSYANVSLTTPWKGSNVVGGNGAIYTKNTTSGWWWNTTKTYGTITFTVPAGYSNDTFTVQVTTANTSYGAGNITVKSNKTSAVGHTFVKGETYGWTVTASAGDVITIYSTDNSYSPDMTLISVYGGASSAGASSTSANTEFVINGIQAGSTSINLSNLVEGGTYSYYIVANYVDGTSATSNTQEVTLVAPNANPNMGANTGVNTIATDGDEVVSVTYVNMSGVQSKQPWDGINIVVTRYKSGAVKSSKVRF